MNKKNLSVVMAGAMLATSVAPVLADTTATEIGLSQKALLRNQIKNKMAEKYLTTNSVILADSTGKYVSSDVKAELTATEDASAYGIKVLDADGKTVDLNDIDSSITDNTKVTYKVTEMEKVLNSDKLKDGYTVQVLERYTTEFMGQIIPGSALTVKEAAKTYTAADITSTTTAEGELKPSDTKFVKTVEAIDTNEDSTNDALKVTLNKLKDINDSESNETLTLKVDDKRLNGELPVDKDGNLLDMKSASDIQKFDHFAELVTYNASAKVANEPTVVASYKLVDDNKDDSKEDLTVADLYDGFALTAKGTEILSDLSNAAEAKNETIASPTDSLVQLSSSEPSLDATGIASFTVTYYKNDKDKQAGKASKVITVRSTNEKEIKSLYNLLKTGDFQVGIVGGDNRYETAVNVAKANKTAISTSNDASYNAHIVLVNGESLVDGLAASPLAATINKKDSNGASSTKSAPVLLTGADKLATATKEYLEELTEDIAPSARKTITVDLVGGESVLSASLENELKNMGFSVARYGGDDREETSLEVAEEITSLNNDSNNNDVFIVGGNGEADAMSIAAVASTAKHGTGDSKVAPIVVSSVHGLTNDALKFVKSNSLNGDITIVGGESVVSKDEENKINETLESKNSATRIAGDNRFETNAKVIKEYYGSTIKGSTGVVVVKDGQSNKSELVDALSAANYAAGFNAPVVLASSSVKDSQKNALLNLNIASTGKVAQVGVGAERTVLETVAGLFGISNVK